MGNNRRTLRLLLYRLKHSSYSFVYSLVMTASLRMLLNYLLSHTPGKDYKLNGVAFSQAQAAEKRKLSFLLGEKRVTQHTFTAVA